MADIPLPGYQAFWTNKRKSFKAEFGKLLDQHPEAEPQLIRLFKVLCDIEDVSGFTPASVGENQDWSFIVSTVEENRAKYCKALSGKTLYSALYGTYSVTLKELKELLKGSIFSEEKGETKSRGEPRREE
jgi:hypothetical protein